MSIVSNKIFSEIQRANSVLLALHVSPDGDSVASVLAMNEFLERMGKKTKIISFSKIPNEFNYLSGIEKVEIINFKKIDFSNFDLFIALDCAQQSMVTKSDYPCDKFPDNFKVINIDHHLTNPKFGDINLINPKACSTSEIIYQLFLKWKVIIDKKLAYLIFLGILTDTGCFQYPSTNANTFKIAGKLMKLGADLNQIVLMHYRSVSLNTVKYWSRVLQNMKLDESGKFVISVMSIQEMSEAGIDPEEDIGGASSFFAPIIKGTEFGIIIDENEGFIKGSIRSRAGMDVSKIAEELGGGGHKLASGFTLKMPLDEAVEKVIETARKELVKNKVRFTT